jgi:DNA repair exonuclease SbcCD ATPase subunit
MHKQINKLKNEFDNLSSLLKEVAKIISSKESEINKSIVCRDDLMLFREKLNEIKGKQKRLSELTEERETIDKNIDASKRQYDDFKRSEEFLNITDTMQKIKDRKNEILMFEKNMINMISNLSRPITKFSYLASKETQVRLALLQNEPLAIFNDRPQYMQLFGEIRKQVIEKKIQIKDPGKTIHQIDEIVDSLPSLSSKLKNLKEDLSRLESSVNSKNIRHLEEMKYKTEMFEKYLSDNNSTMEQTKTNINELDSAIETLKKKIQDDIFEVTNTRYFILRDQN